MPTARSNDYLARFEPEPNASCVCGSGRKFKRCCRNRYNHHAGDLATKRFDERRYSEALDACRRHLTWYLLCHRAHTIPFLRSGDPAAKDLLNLDIGAVAHLIDLLYYCYRKTGISKEFPSMLLRLESSVADPRWRDKIVYFRALWAFADEGDSTSARTQLASLDISKTTDVDILALYIDVHAGHLGFEEQIQVFDHILEVTDDPAYRLQYTSAKGVAFCLICELRKGCDLIQQAVHTYRGLDSTLHSNYGDFRLAQALLILAELSGYRGTAREALTAYRDLLNKAKAVEGHFTQEYFADLAKFLGDCHSFLGEYVAAISRYEESLKLKESPLAKIFGARAYANSGALDSARSVLEGMDTPTLSDANMCDYAFSWALLAAASLQERDISRAVQELKQTNPSAPLFVQQRDVALIELLEAHPKQASGRTSHLLEMLNRYVSLNPNLFGIGINLNKIVEDLQKRRNEKP
jgi:tetratricopeptide (TPR) repeat protein